MPPQNEFPSGSKSRATWPTSPRSRGIFHPPWHTPYHAAPPSLCFTSSDLRYRLQGKDQAQGEESEQKFSWKDVAKHNTSESCWVAVRGKVYDITRKSQTLFFASLPPGCGTMEGEAL